MPQVIDLEALVCGGADGKVACETSSPEQTPVSASRANGLDEPAESFRLPFKDGIDWIDLNAASFFDRDDSTKEITNPKSVVHQHLSGNLGSNPKSNSSSQRFSSKPKAPIIALPNKLRHSGYLGHSRRHAPIFPKKGKKGGAKPAVPDSEPTSPKVSCMGRVRSDRDRRRRCRNTHVASQDSFSPSATASSTPRRERAGIWSAICRFSCFRRRIHSPGADDDRRLTSSRTTTTTTNSTFDRSTPRGEPDNSVPAAPGLGAMKRFASGRRSDSWSEEPNHDDPGVLRRRMAGALQDIKCDRDWKNQGPASA